MVASSRQFFSLPPLTGKKSNCQPTQRHSVDTLHTTGRLWHYLALMSSRFTQLQEQAISHNRVAQKAGPSLNKKKTQVMTIDPTPSSLITIDDEELKMVEGFI